MSGSSLDGLDIVYVHLHAVRGQWSYTVEATDCMPYEASWQAALQSAPALSGLGLQRLHTAYGKYTGDAVNAFIAQHALEMRVDFIASHGHTVFHEPEHNMTFQLGDGATIAATTGMVVISDLRAMDVALGGQGAPIVPIGDQLLFAPYKAWLNLGGIANISIRQKEDTIDAFDICPCNQLLNRLANTLGQAFDGEGSIAASGRVDKSLLSELNELAFYGVEPPKSLSNTFAIDHLMPILNASAASTEDKMATVVHHISQQIAYCLPESGLLQEGEETPKLLVTGGGALNTFLITKISEAARLKGWELSVPDEETIQYKEAIVMALIGALRWREENNVFNVTTGASRNSVGGAFWMGMANGE